MHELSEIKKQISNTNCNFEDVKLALQSKQNLRNDVEGLKETCAKITKKNNQILLKEVQKSSEIALKKEIKAIEERITDISKGKLSERREEEDKERRRRNIVVFNLPESCANSAAEELKDDDCKVIKTLITERMEMTSMSIELKKNSVVRLDHFYSK